MNIKIEFYGRLKAQFSNQPINMTVESSNTIEDIIDRLCQKQQSNINKQVIKPILNDTFANWDDTVNDNDVIGLFPPAAGG